MEAGHEQFYVKVYEKTAHTSIAPGYIERVLVTANWAGDKPSYTLVNGHEMIESEDGVLGTKEAKLVGENDDDRHWMAYGPDGVWVQFNLMKPYRVDEIRIWNYKQNVGYGLSQRGMKNVRIEYTVQSTLIGIHSKYQSCAKHMIENLPLLVKLLKLRVNSCA